ncbi:MAG: NADP-dependent isocitrate dehydrogenase [Shewanellaceae bacterium]|nr:NADP-dependent isocitrate dehydrogenase [Shewanellaceae bacterium]
MSHSKEKADIIWTYTDEAPALATHSLLPMVQAILASIQVSVETLDISLAARILSQFPDYLSADQRVSDALAQLAEIVVQPDANIIKLPNISASLTQLKAAISELQQQGYAIPDYPDNATDPKAISIRRRFDKIKGSAVNPVLREGNSDRRVAPAVKRYAQQHPHAMQPWSKQSKAHVSSMVSGDFYSTEKALTLMKDEQVRIVLDTGEEQQLLKDNLALTQGDVVDASVMRRAALIEFFNEQIDACQTQNVLFSLHLKATMMKVTDPIVFGHAVAVFCQPWFEQHAAIFAELGVDPREGLEACFNKVKTLPAADQQAIMDDYKALLQQRPALAMVDSDKGITNLHRSNDVIVDASMPAAIRDGGCMYNEAGELQAMKAVIPDRTYAGVYQQTIDFCRQHGAFDPSKMGNVANVGLMANKAQEYGSHDKTFEIPTAGTVRVLNQQDEVLFEHEVAAGDIWRMCRVTDAAVTDWVNLAVQRVQQSQTPAIFWLDDERAHDAQLIKKVHAALQKHHQDNVSIQIDTPERATLATLKAIQAGDNVIAVTGNVLRDYLTDLFPILELGTSAKMLSIVPLMQGGGLFETGAGGSAPKHVQQFLQEDYLRWDSLGEFLALGVSLEHLARVGSQPQAAVLAAALDKGVAQFLTENKSPTRRIGGIDNRGSHFYFIWYWVQAIANQTQDLALAKRFEPLHHFFDEHQTAIEHELNQVQGQARDIGGYYHPKANEVTQYMRPSPLLNRAFELLSVEVAAL